MPQSRNSGGLDGRDPGDESKTMAVPSRRGLRPGKLDVGVFRAEVASKVTEKPVPFFTSVELSKLDKACRRSTFA